MPSIQSLGVGSGLDVSSIITKLMSLEQQPMVQLQSAEKGIQTQISSYGSVKSKVDALGSALDALRPDSAWEAKTVDTGGRTEVTITTGVTTSATTLDLSVSQLAQRQSISSARYAATNSSVGSGTLSITLGEWSSSFQSFTASGSPVDINITAPNDTLEGIRDAINAGDAGVRASILTDSGGSRLVIRSSETGLEQGFQIEASTPELQAFSFRQADPQNPINLSAAPGATSMQGNVAAQNLVATLNGVEVSGATNKLSNVFDGISLEAHQVTAANGPISVNVAVDKAGIASKIGDAVKAYNEAVGFLKQATAYDDASKTAGPLQGDQITLSLINQLRTAITQTTAASGLFGRLSEVGIALQKDGTLSVNDSKLQTALNDHLSEVKSLFARSSNLDSEDGIAVSVGDLVDRLTGSNGLISSRQESLQARLRRNQADQDKLQQRLDAVEARLTATYSALDTKMGTLSSLSSYVTQQITAMNNSQSKN